MQNLSQARAQANVERKIKFFAHIVVYFLVNFGVTLNHWQVGQVSPWPSNMASGWAIGLFCHAAFIYLYPVFAGLKKRLIENELKKSIPSI